MLQRLDRGCEASRVNMICLHKQSSYMVAPVCAALASAAVSCTSLSAALLSAFPAGNLAGLTPTPEALLLWLSGSLSCYTWEESPRGGLGFRWTAGVLAELQLEHRTGRHPGARRGL